MFLNLLLVGLGSFAGGVARYAVAQALTRWPAGQLPLATLAVNVGGCLLVGSLLGLIERHTVATAWRLLLVVGFCGGFTTFSTFMNETFRLARDGHMPTVLLYAGLSLVLGYAAVWGGYALTHWQR